MNKEEYELMRQEMTDLVYKYELFVKDGSITDLRYNKTFYDQLKKHRYYEIENEIMAKAIEIQTKNNTGIELPNFISKMETSYHGENQTAVKKNEYANQIIPLMDKISPNEKHEFEQYFHDFIYKYHPLITLTQDKDYINSFQVLRRCYCENNRKSFNAILDTLTNKLDEMQKTTTEEFTEASIAYYDIRVNISKQMLDNKTKYPYNKTEVFQDNMTIQAEKDDIEIQTDKLRQAGLKIHKDYINVFGKDYKLA